MTLKAKNSRYHRELVRKPLYRQDLSYAPKSHLRLLTLQLVPSKKLRIRRLVLAQMRLSGILDRCPSVAHYGVTKNGLSSQATSVTTLTLPLHTASQGLSFPIFYTMIVTMLTSQLWCEDYVRFIYLKNSAKRLALSVQLKLAIITLIAN